MSAADEVTDPSDWLSTSLSNLTPLDSALRCQVCREFFSAPMITSCAHTFCSLCIRRCLSNDGKCPACRKEDQSSKLRVNGAVQEAVDAFVAARTQALQLARKRDEDDHPKRKRRKLDINGDLEKEVLSAQRQTRASTRRSGRGSLPSSQQEVIAIADSDDEGDDEFIPERRERPQESSKPDDGLVACPMCNRRMKEEAVFSHLDRCDGKAVKEKPPPAPILGNSRNGNPTTRSNPPPRVSSPAKHLTHINYALLKDNALKKKLLELGIPTFGDRQLLMRRHTQWVDIFNANQDASRPKTNRELLRDLDVWERTQGGHAPQQGSSGSTGVMRKDFNGEAWTGKHKEQFDDLVAQARVRAKRKQQAEEDKGSESKPAPTKSPAPANDAMEGLQSTTPRKPPALDTTKSQHSLAVEISSPVASMLHSAAQDVRRRSSISASGSPASAIIPGHISTHSIPSTSPSPFGAPTPLRMNGASPHQGRNNSIGTGDSLPAKLATAGSSGGSIGEVEEIDGVKKMPMFRMPEQPINDVEGLGAAGGGGS